MSQADSGAVARKLLDAMNSHDLGQVASVASEDVDFVDVASGEEIHGREQWRQYCGRYLKAFPDMRLEEANLAAMGDSVVLEAIARGTHDRARGGPGGEIPPTGRAIEMRFCLVARVRDGEMVESRE